MKVKKEILYNFGYIESKIPKELYINLLDECLNAENKNQKIVTGLTSYGVVEHFYVKKNEIELTKFILNFRDEYEKNFPGLANTGVLSKNLNFVCSKHWINLQKKYDFLPNHTHDGIFSYTIWMKIPKKIKKSKYSGNFEFSYAEVSGKIFNKVINLTDKDEGKIIMFPSKLQHCVYPFRDTDETRISISGNILFYAP
jgi:hypothetical protein